MTIDQEREAYLVAALSPGPSVQGLGDMVSRDYVREKVQFAFSTGEEATLLARLDKQRQAVYFQYLRKRHNGR